MDEQAYGDLIALARDLVDLFREHELEKARERVRAARCKHATRSFDERAEVIHHVNLAIRRLRSEREEVRVAVFGLPDDEKLFAEAQIEPVLDEVFNAEIAALKAVKRVKSRP
jgi:hypothetical protein